MLLQSNGIYPPASNATGPARNTMEVRGCSLLKQRSSQMSHLVLKFLMYGILPCNSTIEQIPLCSTTVRYSTVGQGQGWEEEEAVPCPAQTTAWGLGSFCLPSAGHHSLSVYFTPAPVPRSFFNSALVLSSGLTTLQAEIIYLSREQLFLPCWKHSVPAWPYPGTGRKGQFISWTHSLFINL